MPDKIPATVCLSAEFEGSYPSYQILPPADLPELAIVGRSNVGKSSLLNALVNRKSLARVGKTPGVTRQVNLFYVVYRNGRQDIEFRIADLPGYGFAKVPAGEQKRWNKELERYLVERPSLSLLLLLVDCRREIKEEEEFFLRANLEYPRWVIGTKRDQILKRETPAWVSQVTKAGFSSHLVSVDKRQGVDELREDIFKFFLG